MQVRELKLKGVFEITPDPKQDQRGYFVRTFDDKIFKENGLTTDWVQESQSLSKAKGVIRGLHFQYPPFTEAKLVRVIKGKILDVFVDIRKNSPTFGQYGSGIISEENKKMLVLPKGFAHGFCALTENCEVIYKMDNYFSPEHQARILWNDKTLNIDWGGVKNPLVSDLDNNAQTFEEFIDNYGGIEVTGFNPKKVLEQFP